MGIARGRLQEERKSWRKCVSQSCMLGGASVRAWSTSRIPLHALTRHSHIRPSAAQGFVAKPATLPDGTQDILNWDVVIPGKDGTIWDGARIPMTMTFSEDYPNKPPICKFKFVGSTGKPLFHPNVYPSGKICLSLLDADKVRMHPLEAPIARSSAHHPCIAAAPQRRVGSPRSPSSTCWWASSRCSTNRTTKIPRRRSPSKLTRTIRPSTSRR